MSRCAATSATAEIDAFAATRARSKRAEEEDGESEASRAGTEEPPCRAPDLLGREERQELGERAPPAGSGGMDGGGNAHSDLRQLLEITKKCVAAVATV